MEAVEDTQLFPTLYNHSSKVGIFPKPDILITIPLGTKQSNMVVGTA